MMQAKNQRTRVNKVRMKLGSNEATPHNNKAIARTKSNIHANSLDWTRQLFNNITNVPKPQEVKEKVISTPECWIDYFLAIHFGILVCAKQMRHALNLNRSFEKYVKTLWVNYISCYRNKPTIGSFTAERRGGLQLDKRKQVKRFEFFTPMQLEAFADSLKQVPLKEKSEMRNKEYLTLVRDTYYQLRYDKDPTVPKRKLKEASKMENDTLDFLKNNTICYNDQMYSKFKSPENVFDLTIYPELQILTRAMIYVQKKYPLNSLVKGSRIDPVKLLRNIKYKNGKMLNIEDRTYTAPVLSGILDKILTSLDLNIDLNFRKFISSRLKKRDKLVLLIFTLDLISNDHTVANANSETSTSFVKHLRVAVTKYVSSDYLSYVNSQDDKDW